MTLGLYGYIDDATYWPSPTETGYGGKTFDPPQVVKTKWEDTIEQFIDRDGSETQSQSVVYMLFEPDEDGYLALGDHSGVTDPTELKGAYQIKRVDKVRDLRGLHEEITAYL